MGQYRAFLGAACETARAMAEDLVVVKPRDHSRITVIENLRQAVEARRFSPGQASKVRGRTNWVATNTFGKIGRLGISVLKAIQYAPGAHSQLTQDQCDHLSFHLEVVQRVRGRRVDLRGEREVPVVAYTDAEFTPHRAPRLGGVVFSPRHSRPLAFTTLVSEDHMAGWKQRTQQIYMAELTAVSLLLARYADRFRDNDALIFIDNEGALAALIRMGSGEEDAELVAQIVHALATMLNCRVWWDWVDSKSNPADALSRVGLAADPVRSGAWHGEHLPPFPSWRCRESPWLVARRLLEHPWEELQTRLAELAATPTTTSAT